MYFVMIKKNYVRTNESHMITNLFKSDSTVFAANSAAYA